MSARLVVDTVSAMRERASGSNFYVRHPNIFPMDVYLAHRPCLSPNLLMKFLEFRAVITDNDVRKQERTATHIWHDS